MINNINMDAQIERNNQRDFLYDDIYDKSDDKFNYDDFDLNKDQNISDFEQLLFRESSPEKNKKQKLSVENKSDVFKIRKDIKSPLIIKNFKDKNSFSTQTQKDHQIYRPLIYSKNNQNISDKKTLKNNHSSIDLSNKELQKQKPIITHKMIQIKNKNIQNTRKKIQLNDSRIIVKGQELRVQRNESVLNNLSNKNLTPLNIDLSDSKYKDSQNDQDNDGIRKSLNLKYFRNPKGNKLYNQDSVNSNDNSEKKLSLNESEFNSDIMITMKNNDDIKSNNEIKTNNEEKSSNRNNQNQQTGNFQVKLIKRNRNNVINNSHIDDSDLKFNNSKEKDKKPKYDQDGFKSLMNKNQNEQSLISVKSYEFDESNRDIDMNFSNDKSFEDLQLPDSDLVDSKLQNSSEQVKFRKNRFKEKKQLNEIKVPIITDNEDVEVESNKEKKSKCNNCNPSVYIFSNFKTKSLDNLQVNNAEQSSANKSCQIGKTKNVKFEPAAKCLNMKLNTSISQKNLKKSNQSKSNDKKLKHSNNKKK